MNFSLSWLESISSPAPPIWTYLLPCPPCHIPKVSVRRQRLPLHTYQFIEGMDLNPLFTGPTLFRPGGKGGELDLFKHAGIDLVHGWLVDPRSPEAPAVTKVEDYDSAVDLVATADHITKGQLLGTDATSGPSSPTSPLDAEDRTKVEDGEFLSSRTMHETHHIILASHTRSPFS